MSNAQDNYNKWYHWGRWVQSVLATSPWLELSNTEAFKKIGFDFIGDAKDLDHHYFFLKKDLKKVEQFTEEKLLKDRKWFDNFFLLCDKKIDQVLSFEGKKDINGFFKEVPECLSYSMVIEFLDYGIEKYLEKLQQETGITIGKVLSRIGPYKKTFLMKYQNELKSLKERDIPKFVKKYKWIGTHHFKGTCLNEEKVRKEISDISKKKELKKKIKLPNEYKKVIEVGSKLAFYRFHLVETVDRVTFSYWSVIKKIAKNNKLSWDEVLLLTHKELIRFNNKKILPKNYKERKKGFGIMNVNKKITVVTGAKLLKELNECQEKISTKNIAELKGMIAYRGRVRGIVKIVEQIKDIPKLKKGEILVANETTPDYIVGMKIAGAVIANQGGITSHAAIISREFEIPCIIGTKIATKVLKDGDLVEVDANKGIVKIIKKKNA